MIYKRRESTKQNELHIQAKDRRRAFALLQAAFCGLQPDFQLGFIKARTTTGAKGRCQGLRGFSEPWTFAASTRLSPSSLEGATTTSEAGCLDCRRCEAGSTCCHAKARGLCC